MTSQLRSLTPWLLVRGRPSSGGRSPDLRGIFGVASMRLWRPPTHPELHVPGPPMKLRHFFKIDFLRQEIRFLAEIFFEHRSIPWLKAGKFSLRHLKPSLRKIGSCVATQNLFPAYEK